MRYSKPRILFLLAGVLGLFSAQAYINPAFKPAAGTPPQGNGVSFRFNCDKALAQIDQQINNVRARLLTGGDVWWDGRDNGRYIVPKTPPNVPEVSSLFAGAVWLGGIDQSGNLKVAAQTYGTAFNPARKDFWPGPLTPDDSPNPGTTDQTVCSKWDRFFVVKGSSIEQHIKNFQKAQAEGIPYDPDIIPRDVKGWPGRGNPFFEEINRFALPNTRQGLAGFWDADGDGDYNPQFGDYPIIEIRGCNEPQYPDEMIFWVYNDNGNIHSESRGDAIQMEIQVQAFAYATNDELNDMTFQRYKLINRAIEPIDSTFFAMWSDPDLGCYTDDYVGCDTTRSLAYVYNIDALDGDQGTCNCGQVNTYCDEIPLLGIDYFRGPQRYIEDAQGRNIDSIELGMSSFTYYNNGGVTPTPLPGTTDPANAQEYYNYLTGSWRDGRPFQFGGSAYQTGGRNIRYAFVDPPDKSTGWSMCTQNLPAGDRRTIQASGPFKLKPGAINELIIGVVWVPNQRYPCPSIRRLQEADDLAQDLFDSCFDIKDGPDAPDVDFVELDRELIVMFTNDRITSNNFNELYREPGLGIPSEFTDSNYVFEGYKLFQVSGPNVKLDATSLEDPTKVRLVFQVDIKNGIKRIFNWRTLNDPTTTPTVQDYYVPELMVDGEDSGIRHSFRITEDQFASGDRRLINHKIYYFIAVAYAHNEYLPFDPLTAQGQRMPYCEGRRNIGPNGDGLPYAAIPRPITDRKLLAQYGDGAIITRIDGRGTGDNFLDMDPSVRAKIEQDIRNNVYRSAFNGEILYRPGRGPINVKVVNPLTVVDGDFELRFVDANMNDSMLAPTARWTLRQLNVPNAPIIASDTTIERLNEQIIKSLGIAVTIGQIEPPGTRTDATNGAIGVEIEYPKATAPKRWLSGIPNGLTLGISNLDQTAYRYIYTERDEFKGDVVQDPTNALSTMGNGIFVPFYLTNWRDRLDLGAREQGYISPAWFETTNSVRFSERNANGLQFLNNVDIVFTPNKDLWSRCPVVETGGTGSWTGRSGFTSVGNRRNLEVRADSSVLKEANPATGRPLVGIIRAGEPRLGMGWFPGYAIDVETGQRLNIFWGENSAYSEKLFTEFPGVFSPATFNNEGPRGGDMMFNPTSQLKIPRIGDESNIFEFYTGGQHFVYVTRTPYDQGVFMESRLRNTSIGLNKAVGISRITWTGMIVPNPNTPFLSYAEGLVPDTVIVKIRVRGQYRTEVTIRENNVNYPPLGTGINNVHPAYRFSIRGKQAEPLDAASIEDALDQIRVVPNPYYGFSSYETSQFTNIIKITNLPPKCVVTIYSLDGKFIRQYNRDEVGEVPRGVNRAIERKQIYPDLEWDLKNSKGIPIASGVYLIHVSAPGLGERTIKWFGINRKFDPSGL